MLLAKCAFLLFDQSLDQSERKMRKANSYRCHHQSLSLKPLSGRQSHTHTHAQAVFSTGQDLEQDRGQCNYCQLIRHIFSVPIGQTVRRANSCLCSLAVFLSFAPFTASVQTVMLLLLFLLFFVFLKETNEKREEKRRQPPVSFSLRVAALARAGTVALGLSSRCGRSQFETN